MMLRSGSFDGPTGSGVPPSPSTTSEQVASNPIPAICPRRCRISEPPPAPICTTACQISVAGLFDDAIGFAVKRDVGFRRRQHVPGFVEDARPRAAGADIDADDAATAPCLTRSTLCGRMTRSRIVTPRGRVSMNSTASATSLGCIRLPLASASSILAFGQSSSSAVTTGPGSNGADADAVFGDLPPDVWTKACTANFDAV